MQSPYGPATMVNGRFVVVVRPAGVGRGWVKTHRAAEMPDVVVSFAAVRSILTVPRASNREASHSREIVFAFSHSLDQERSFGGVLQF